ncbi:hypothetical protein ACHAPT_011030 [Fusarium lateritium]
MRYLTSILLALTSLAVASSMSEGQDVPPTLTRRSREQLELHCTDRSLFCCDELSKEDEEAGEDSGTGYFANCSAVPNNNISACSLKKDCKRTPACCDYSEAGGPIPNPMHCRDLREVLKEENHEDFLICKEKSSGKNGCKAKP